MFDPFPDLIQTHTLALPSGEAITFDQTLWGKVIVIRTLHVEGGRYHLDDTMMTARLRQQLEAMTIEGSWAFGPEDARFDELKRELRELIALWYGVSFDA